MTRKVLITLRRKPKKPIKQLNKLLRYDVYEGTLLSEIIKKCHPNAEFEFAVGRYTDEAEVQLVWYESESDEDLEKRTKEYECELIKYETWYKENEEIILKEIKRRADEKQEKKVQRKKEGNRRG